MLNRVKPWLRQGNQGRLKDYELRELREFGRLKDYELYEFREFGIAERTLNSFNSCNS